MKFREDYRQRFNKKMVDLHDFKEGMVVLLHRPEQVKVNPKIQSKWFGPFLILSMVGTTNALIQDIGNKKTKFVNTNRLRAYNSTIAEWEKEQALKEKKKNAKLDAQTEKKGDDDHFESEAGPPLRWTDFDLDNDVAILNPEAVATHRPMLEPPGIKEEPEEAMESVPNNDSTQEDQNDQIPPPSPTAGSSQSPNSRESMGDTLVEMLPKINKPKRPTRSNTELKGESGVKLFEKLKIAEKKIRPKNPPQKK